MEFELNDTEVIKGHSDVYQVVKFSLIYLFFIALFLGIKVLNDMF